MTVEEEADERLQKQDATPAAVGPADALAASFAKDAAKLDPEMAARVADVLEQQSQMLRAQTRLLHLQAEDLRKEDRIRHWSLRVRHINDLMKLTFALSGGFILLIAAIGIGALVWNAHQASGLVFQPLKVPSDFAARGFDGTVLAQKLLDKMNALVVRGDKWSFRSADSVSGNWGEDSKVEIPETGISVVELSRFLRQKLGRETSMSGELVHKDRGIALTVRVGSGIGSTFVGPESDIENLLDQAAHALLSETQSYRYLWVLYDEGRPPASIAPIAQRFAETASDRERPWIRSAWEEMIEFSGDFRDSAALSAKTIAQAPNNPSGFIDYSPAEWALGHLELAQRTIKQARSLLETRSDPDFAAAAVPFMVANCRSFEDNLAGAYSDAIADDIEESKTGLFDFNVSGPGSLANDMALDHDPKGALAILAKHRLLHDATLMQPEFVITTGPALPEFFIAAITDDWTAAKRSLERTDRAAEARSDFADVTRTFIRPWLAYADARSGYLAEARALIAKTPTDCALCLEMRGRIDELMGNDRGAVYWYGHAVAAAPSIPFTYIDWGRLFMRQQDLNGAIEKFRSANVKSPHNADALELWGEALMLSNRSDLALAKFEEANKYAPNWGHLHLEWGKAFAYAGRMVEAQAQLGIARTLQLSKLDKQALAQTAKLRS